MTKCPDFQVQSGRAPGDLGCFVTPYWSPHHCLGGARVGQWDDGGVYSREGADAAAGSAGDLGAELHSLDLRSVCSDNRFYPFFLFLKLLLFMY